ncbi:MAG: hypothetical protein EA364_02930 [Balneolaceae bacterium]|jgi:uncharacterized membrane protein YfbV (UPF0208 family)|nr:MAG: hypothetical protein EA364_02930 [Balneolaceae bacterium]
MVPIAIGLTLILIAAGVIGILIFGFMNVVSGKLALDKMLTVAVPFVLAIIAYFVFGDATQAAIFTMLLMIGIVFLGIFLTGARSSFIKI